MMIAIVIILSLINLFLWSEVFYRVFFKRFYDIVFSGSALLLLSPFFLVTAILVRVRLGSPVFFKQERPGKDARIFKMYKFRTMLNPQTRDGRILTDKERLECIEKGIDIMTDEERLPKIGKILRSTSVDELPELWNIFIGDMSFVGPRPLATIYLPYYSKEEMRRHLVRPGLTGWAQIHGRNYTSWKKRFEYDIFYVDNCSLFLDIKVLFQTVAVVFKREGIGQGEERPIAFNIERQDEWNKGTVKKDR